MYFFVSSSQNPSNSNRKINTKYNTFCSQKCLHDITEYGKLQCKCGEDVPIFEWTWSQSNSSTSARFSSENKEILFHPVYSTGTAAVRGEASFEQNVHHYWEIKIISNLYGTDVMIGIGTSKIDLMDWQLKFCSMLGMDSQSWGYSYHGIIQHDQLTRKYGTHYGLGSIIGVYLNMCTGTLEYYINRKPLGIAFRGLKNKELYPMVSSTAAQSAVRVSCAVSEKDTLQMRCLKSIMKYPEIYKRYRQIPGLTRRYDRQYFWILPTSEQDENKRLADLEDDVTLSLVDKGCFSKNKKFRAISWIPPEIFQDTDDDSDVSETCIFDTSIEGNDNSLSSNEDIPSTSKCPDKCQLRSEREDKNPGDSPSNCDVTL